MPRRTFTAHDPNEFMSPTALAEPPEASPAETDAEESDLDNTHGIDYAKLAQLWPNVAWRDYDLRWLRYAVGQASPDDLAKIADSGMNRGQIRREVGRVVGLAHHLPNLVTRSRLAELEHSEAAKVDELNRRRNEERARFERLQEEHRARLAELDAQEQATSRDLQRNRDAVASINTFLPPFIVEKRWHDVAELRRSPARDELCAAEAVYNFIRQAVQYELMVMVERGSMIRTDRSIAHLEANGEKDAEYFAFVPGRIGVPDWMFDPDSLGYVGPRPVAERRHDETEDQALCRAVHPLWKPVRERLRSMLPASAAEVERLRARTNQASKARYDAIVARDSYVQD